MPTNNTPQWSGHVFVSEKTKIPEPIATFTQGRNTFVVKLPDAKFVRLCQADTAAKQFAQRLNASGQQPSNQDLDILDLPQGSIASKQDIDADLVEFTNDGSISTVDNQQPQRHGKTKRPRDDSFDR